MLDWAQSKIDSPRSNFDSAPVELRFRPPNHRPDPVEYRSFFWERGRSRGNRCLFLNRGGARNFVPHDSLPTMREKASRLPVQHLDRARAYNPVPQEAMVTMGESEKTLKAAAKQGEKAARDLADAEGKLRAMSAAMDRLTALSCSQEAEMKEMRGRLDESEAERCSLESRLEKQAKSHQSAVEGALEEIRYECIQPF